MNNISNEGKLDLFFFKIKNENITDRSILYREGLKTRKYFFSSNEAQLYFKRFKDDGLIDFLDKDTFIYTEKGMSFKGYVSESKKPLREYFTWKKIAAAIVFLIIILTFLMDAYDFTGKTLFQWLNKDQEIESKQIAKPNKLDTSILHSKNDTADSTK